MKVDEHSKLWTYPGGAHSEALHEFRFEAFLHAYEERLVDEYIECQLHINNYPWDDVGHHQMQWWLGSRERIEMEVAHLEEEYGIYFDKVRELKKGIPRYKDMSAKSQENYRRITKTTPE